MNKIRVAINGFGRIGRTFFRAALSNPSFEIVAINDLGSPENLAYLLKYDTVYGRAKFPVTSTTSKDANGYPGLIVDNVRIILLQERDTAKLPWGALNIDVVVEASGANLTCDKTAVHITAGAKRVVLSAPFADCYDKGDSPHTVLIGINDMHLREHTVTSNASCTTNAIAPIISILHGSLGIEKAMINTTHAYTASQRIVDGANVNDFRIGRAAAMNLIPSSTGATHAVMEVIPELMGKIDGIALRVPVISGSVADLTFVSKRKTTIEEVNQILYDAAADERWKGVFAVTDEPIVSSDIIGQPFGAIADLTMTRVVEGDLVKVFSWYDNEAGYVATLVQHVQKVAEGFFATH